jgi:F-type H+-transporting ATPase subunit epsilon
MSLELNIVTPEGTRYEGQVEALVVPGAEGDFGVLPGHERFLAAVRIGELQIQDGRSALWAAVSDGFAEVNGDKVVLMVDSCEFAGDIDAARAERARARAEREIEQLRAAHAEAKNFLIEERALQRALIRIQVASKPQRPM